MTYIELNGARSGPYEEFGGGFVMSSDGEHLAYAVKSQGQWCVVLDGSQKWCHSSIRFRNFGPTALATTRYLDGSGVIKVGSFTVAQLQFSPQGSVQYGVNTASGKWAVAFNGRLGAEFASTDDVKFAAGRPIYLAWRNKDSNQSVLVHGDRLLEPLEKAFPPKVSADGMHYVTVVANGNQQTLIVDGVNRKVAREILAWEIGPIGQVIYSFKVGDKLRVSFDSKDLQGEYDGVEMLKVSPDGKHFAFWAMEGATSKVITDLGSHATLDGFYFNEIESERLIFFWSEDGTKLAYTARQGSGRQSRPVLMMNGEIVPKGPGEPAAFNAGVILTGQLYQDDKRNIVGKKDQAPAVDRKVFVKCVQLIDKGCDPWTAKTLRGKPAWLDSNAGGTSLVIEGEKQGAFPGTSDELVISPDGLHHAFMVKTPEGYRAVLDGNLQSPVYQSYWALRFQRNESLVYAGLRDGQIYGVRHFIPTAVRNVPAKETATRGTKPLPTPQKK
jgi:hypothetical protein